jgi:hypothetical protein
MSISHLKWRPLSRQTGTATVGKNNHDKTDGSVSCPTEALFFETDLSEQRRPRVLRSVGKRP